MQLFLRTLGSGPPLILLHGLFGSHDNLGILSRELAADHTVVAIDLRNHGRSPHADDMRLQAMAADVRETMATAGVEEAVVLGHSLGGKVAMELALREPESVRGLIVLDIAPVAYPPRHDRLLDALLGLDVAELESRGAADRALAEAIPEAPIRQFLLKNLVRDGTGFAWRVPLQTIASRYGEIAAAPIADRCNAPTLFMRGGHSDYVRPEHEAAIHERFPRARIETIEHAGHWLHAEAPNRVVPRVKSFLEA